MFVWWNFHFWELICENQTLRHDFQICYLKREFFFVYCNSSQTSVPLACFTGLIC